MKKLNEVEIYLLEHWEDVMKLEEAVNSFRGKLKDAIQEVAKELEKRDWWTKEFEKSTQEGHVEIWKTTWVKGHESLITVGIGGLKLDNFLGLEEDSPYVFIWNGWLRKKEGEKVQEEFNELFKKYSEKIFKSFKTYKDWICYEFPQTLDNENWLDVIKDGRLGEELNKLFDFLSELIDPIDRALNEVLKKKKK